MNKSMKVIIISALSIFLLSACRNFSDVNLQIINGELHATFPEESRSREIQIHELAVQYQNCTSDCILWEVAKTVDMANSGHLLSNRIKYGQTIPETKTLTPAKSLSTGSYTLTASIHIPKGEKDSKAIQYSSNFELTISDKGLLTLTKR